MQLYLTLKKQYSYHQTIPNIKMNLFHLWADIDIIQMITIITVIEEEIVVVHAAVVMIVVIAVTAVILAVVTLFV